MERVVNLQIEKLPEDVYLATSDNLQGLPAGADLQSVLCKKKLK